MTVQATFTYTIDPDTLQVDTCGIVWGAVHGLQLHGEHPCSGARHSRHSGHSGCGAQRAQRARPCADSRRPAGMAGTI